MGLCWKGAVFCFGTEKKSQTQKKGERNPNKNQPIPTFKVETCTHLHEFPWLAHLCQGWRVLPGRLWCPVKPVHAICVCTGNEEQGGILLLTAAVITLLSGPSLNKSVIYMWFKWMKMQFKGLLWCPWESVVKLPQLSQDFTIALRRQPVNLENGTECALKLIAFGIILLLTAFSYLYFQNKANIAALAPVAMKYFLHEVVCGLVCSDCAELGRHHQKQIGLLKAGGIGLTGWVENPLSCLQVTISTHLANFVLSLFCWFFSLLAFRHSRCGFNSGCCPRGTSLLQGRAFAAFPLHPLTVPVWLRAGAQGVQQTRSQESCLRNWIWDVLNASANLPAGCSNGEKTSFCAVVLSSSKQV